MKLTRTRLGNMDLHVRFRNSFSSELVGREWRVMKNPILAETEQRWFVEIALVENGKVNKRKSRNAWVDDLRTFDTGQPFAALVQTLAEVEAAAAAELTAMPSRSIRCDDELWQAAMAKAEREGVFLSSVIREFLTEWVAE